jgi:hypothetical protein
MSVQIMKLELPIRSMAVEEVATVTIALSVTAAISIEKLVFATITTIAMMSIMKIASKLQLFATATMPKTIIVVMSSAKIMMVLSAIGRLEIKRQLANEFVSFKPIKLLQRFLQGLHNSQPIVQMDHCFVIVIIKFVKLHHTDN